MPIDRSPFPLGKITTNTGTPVPLTANFSSDAAVVAALTSKLTVSPLPANTGNVFLGYANMNTTTLAGVLAVLTPGVPWSYYDATSLNILKVSNLYIDVAVNGEGVLASFDVR